MIVYISPLSKYRGKTCRVLHAESQRIGLQSEIPDRWETAWRRLPDNKVEERKEQ